jgi:hypothetical protein
MTWRILHDLPRRLPSLHPGRPDPYLVWAELTHWEGLFGRAGAAGGSGHPIPLIVELEQDDMPAFRAAFDRLGSPKLLPRVYAHGRFAAVWLPRRLLPDFVRRRGPTGKYIKRFDLCAPQVDDREARPVRAPQTATAASETHAWPLRKERPRLRGDMLIGVIDDGCPFAHARLRATVGRATSTRIAAHWDQRHDGLFARQAPGAMPARMGYGVESVRAGRNGLDAWMHRYRSGVDGVDEAACYEEAHHHDMRARYSHGAHVLDLLVGPTGLRNCVPADADTPPTWAPAGDAAAGAAQTDVAFVQFPRTALQDSSGAWLESHVLDALNYLVTCAGSRTRVVSICLSYGCSVGPHDGKSIIEAAVADLLARTNTGSTKLEVVIAAGNSFDDRSHAVLSQRQFSANGKATLTWRVLPGSENCNFMQVWLPASLSGRDVALSFETPNGEAVDLLPDTAATWPNARDPQATAVFLNTPSRGEGRAMALFVVDATNTESCIREPAPHGDWKLTLTLASGVTLGNQQEIHAFIARNDRDLGALLRGRQSYFADAADDPLAFLHRCADDPGRIGDPIEDDTARAPDNLARRGTLNGIATGIDVIVAAGYEKLNQVHAPYSSAGLHVESPSGPHVRGPDYAMMTDESPALRGVRAAGNTSGATFRLVGTSTAAPQLTRARVAAHAGGPVPGGVTPGPAHPTPNEPADLWGRGLLHPVNAAMPARSAPAPGALQSTSARRRASASRSGASATGPHGGKRRARPVP